MIERSIAFGAGHGLVGTICLPPSAHARASGMGQILFNAGAVQRVGPHRVNVRLARRLALRGIPSIRFDLAGQGDSARAAGDLPHEMQALADIRAAMDALGREAGVHRFALVGFCSGGWHSLALALEDARVAGILMHDAYVFPTARFRWNRVLAPIRKRGFFAAAFGLLGRLPAALRSRLRGNSVAKGEPPYSDATASSVVSRLLGKAEFARRARLLHDRGVKIAVTYTEHLEDYNYREQFRDAFAGLGLETIVECDYFPATGHTFTILAEQERFLQRVEDWTLDVDGACRLGAAASRATAPGG